VVFASREVASNQAGHFTVFGTVRVVAVEPLSKITSILPLAGGVRESVETSPHT